MGLEEAAEEERQALDEDAVVLGAVLEGRAEGGLGGEDARRGWVMKPGEELAEERIVLRDRGRSGCRSR